MQKGLVIMALEHRGKATSPHTPPLYPLTISTLGDLMSSRSGLYNPAAAHNIAISSYQNTFLEQTIHNPSHKHGS